jgi:hypothetical protein
LLALYAAERPRGDVADRATAALQPGTDQQLGQRERSDHVDLERPPHVFDGVFLGPAAGCDAGVVDDDVHAIPDGSGEPAAILLAGDVSSYSPAADLLGQRPQAILAAGRDDNLSPGPGQHPGKAGAEAGRGAGHDRHLPIQTEAVDRTHLPRLSGHGD